MSNYLYQKLKVLVYCKQTKFLCLNRTYLKNHKENTKLKQQQQIFIKQQKNLKLSQISVFYKKKRSCYEILIFIFFSFKNEAYKINSVSGSFNKIDFWWKIILITNCNFLRFYKKVHSYTLFQISRYFLIIRAFIFWS